MGMSRRSMIALAGAMVLAGSAQAENPPPAPAAKATIWHGGPILTMDGDKPQTVAAVVEREGRIIFAGPEARARLIAGRGAADRNLRGATMLPGFIDAHSHFAVALQSAGGIDLSDPALGQIRDIPSMLSALRGAMDARHIPADQWIIGWQYNEEALAERRHITRAELDAAFPGRKIALLHMSLHGLVASSAALAALGIDETTPVPAGGIMPKDADGKLTGLLFEKAMFLAVPKLPQPTPEQKLAALDAAQLRYAREGFTHAQEGGTQLPDLQFLMSQPARDHLFIDVVALPFYTALDWLTTQNENALQMGRYQGHLKIEGVKFVLDGSPQARTAFFTRDYARGAPDGHHPWHGEAGITEADFQSMAQRVDARGWQLFVHANGDAAIDMAINTFDKLGIRARDNRRPVVIHSQFQRADQLAAYRRIGVAPAYFTNHTFYFADTHRTNFPAEVVDFISPMQAARSAGLTVSNHSDFPVTPLSPMAMLWSSMVPWQGLQALTAGPAWQVFDENRAGRIKAGMLADFVVLDRNPLTTPVAQIRTIRVMETVKEGKTIWKR